MEVGRWEMQNKAGEMSGEKTLMKIIRNNLRASARRIVDTFTESLERFRGNEASEDDITLVVIKVKRRFTLSNRRIRNLLQHLTRPV